MRSFGLPEKIEIHDLFREMQFYYGNFQVSLSMGSEDSWVIRHRITGFGGEGLWEISYEAKSVQELKDKVHRDLLDNSAAKKHSPDDTELLELYSKWKCLP